MIDFIKIPNLPEGKVTTVICGTDDEKILSYFSRNRISIIKNFPNQSIDSSVSSHADMAAVHLGGESIVADKNQSGLSEKLTDLGMNVICSENSPTGDYPNDIGLNFAFVGERILGNFNYADKALLKRIEKYEKLSVKQGYCKCSVLVVNQNAIITDDEGISNKAVANGIESLLVAKGDISLDGHPYGFIGGASGKISSDTVIFFGNIEKHRDFQKINTFLSEHGCAYECTDDGSLRDIGGIIPLCEETEKIY